MAAPVIVAENEAEAKVLLERVPPERRPFVNVGTPEQAAEALRPYLDAGFTGFTFNNIDLPHAGGDRPRRRTAPTHRRGLGGPSLSLGGVS